MGLTQKKRAKRHHYDYPMVSVTVDCVIFGWDSDGLHVLLIKRGEIPHKGQSALPGGFLRSGIENLEQAAHRELFEETGVRGAHLEQLGTYGDPERDPREEHVVTVAYVALVKRIDHKPRGGTDASEAGWFPIEKSRRIKLAFDHNKILSDAIKRLYGKLRYDPLGFKLLPNKFPLRDVQRLYETALGHEVDKRNFRKKLLEMGVLEDTEEIEADVRHRAARLYRFNDAEYEKRSRQGFKFDI